MFGLQEFLPFEFKKTPISNARFTGMDMLPIENPEVRNSLCSPV
jgi:hypothetical protein